MSYLRISTFKILQHVSLLHHLQFDKNSILQETEILTIFFLSYKLTHAVLQQYCSRIRSAIQTIFVLPKKKSYFSTLNFLLKFVCAYFENVYKNATIMTSRNKTREKMYFLCFLRNLINIIPIYNSIHNRKIVCKYSRPKYYNLGKTRQVFSKSKMPGLGQYLLLSRVIVSRNECNELF